MIEGLRRPDAGEITLLGQPVWPDPRRIQARIGVQLQSTSLFDMLTARELLELFARFYLRPDGRSGPRSPWGWSGSSRRPTTTPSASPAASSSGSRSHSRWCTTPRSCSWTSPRPGLDPQARLNLWDVIRSINTEQKKTVVLTTHYLEEAEELCERVAIMDQARIVALDTPSGLIAALDADARVSYTDGAGDHTVYVKDAQATVLEVLERARADGDNVSNLSVKGADLEDVFMQLTGREYRE